MEIISDLFVATTLALALGAGYLVISIVVGLIVFAMRKGFRK